MTPRALITGITGMVGSHLLDYLYDNTDWIIHGTYRWRSPLLNISHHIPAIEKKLRIFLHYCDIVDYSSVESVFRAKSFDFVFHLAAQSFPATSFDAPNSTYSTNIQGTENILSNVRKYCPDAIVHNCSSSEVFGRVTPELVPIREETPFHPASPYAISKCGADLIGRYYAEAYNINIQTTRMFTHTGPRRGDVFMESTFAKQIALIEGNYIDPIVQVGNLDSVRTIADVRDAVRAYYMLVTQPDLKPGGVFNIGGNYTAKVESILEYLLSISQRKGIQIFSDPERFRPIDANLQIPDTTRFVTLTGWKPVYSFEQTMQDLLNYWRCQISRNGHEFLSR